MMAIRLKFKFHLLYLSIKKQKEDKQKYLFRWEAGLDDIVSH